MLTVGCQPVPTPHRLSLWKQVDFFIPRFFFYRSLAPPPRAVDTCAYFCTIILLTCTPVARPGRSIRPVGYTGPGRTSRTSGRCAVRFRSTGPCSRPGTRTGTCRTRSYTCPTDGSRSVRARCIRRDLYTGNTNVSPGSVHIVIILYIYTAVLIDFGVVWNAIQAV